MHNKISLLPIAGLVNVGESHIDGRMRENCFQTRGFYKGFVVEAGVFICSSWANESKLCLLPLKDCWKLLT